MMIQRDGARRRRSAWRGLLLGGAALLLSAQAAQAEWRRAETANFLVHGEGSEGDLRRHAERLERFDALLRRQLNVPPMDGARKLPVYLVYTNKELRQVNPNLAEGIAGFYSASEIDVYAVLNRRSGDDILFHEYAHHFMFQNFPGGYPGWFTEGFAEFFMTASVDNADKVTVGYFNPGRLRTLNEVDWIPVEQLLTSRPRDLENRRARSAFYAQSWLLTHYMFMDAGRRRGLDAYLAAVARGTPPVEALRTHLGHTPDSLEAALKAYLRGTMNYAEIRMAETGSAMRFQTLPASADRMLLDSLNIRYPKTPPPARPLWHRRWWSRPKIPKRCNCWPWPASRPGTAPPTCGLRDTSRRKPIWRGLCRPIRPTTASIWPWPASGASRTPIPTTTTCRLGASPSPMRPR